MINGSHIYATVNNGRIHLSDENSFYGKSINSYNNFLTQFFSWIFRKSMQVEVAGKKRFLNIVSYTKFLQNGQQKIIPNIRQLTKLEAAVSHDIFSNWKNNGYIRTYLSEEKRTKLFRKLTIELVKGNLSQALKKIRQGAEIENSFWIREGTGISLGSSFGISFSNINTGLPDRTLEFRGTLFTPLLFAKMRNNMEIFNVLLKAGANRFSTGETVQFNRTITDVERRERLHTELVPTYGRNHRIHYVVQPRVQQEIIIHYNDHAEKLSQFSLDDHLNLVTTRA